MMRADGGGSDAEDQGVLQRELGGGQFEEHEIDVVQRHVAERTNCVATGENTALSSAP